MSDFKKDLVKYGGYRAFLREQSLYCVAIYRLGRCIELSENSFFRFLMKFPYYLLFRFVETIFSTSLPKEAIIGPGLRIWHFGNIFIHSQTIIGENCTLRHGVTIGNKKDGGGAPIIGNNVEIGANSMIVGEVKIGDDCIIGAMTFVNVDVPDGHIAVGIPARIIKKENV